MTVFSPRFFVFEFLALVDFAFSYNNLAFAASSYYPFSLFLEISGLHYS